MIAQAKRNYILMFKNNKFFSFPPLVFVVVFFVFLWRYKNTREAFGDPEKAVETLRYELERGKKIYW